MIVGLGNPGRKYEATRHNVGFEVLNLLGEKLGAASPRGKFEGQFTKVQVGECPLVLLWPLTYMNESGRSVRPAADFFKIDISTDLMVVCDDLSLPVGKLRLKPKGSAGGQKGLNHILNVMGSQEVPRLRIGIGSTPDGWQTPDYVLGKFDRVDRQSIDEALIDACQAIQDWCKHGLAYCMNNYN